jgi:hypothetical protein
MLKAIPSKKKQINNQNLTCVRVNAIICLNYYVAATFLGTQVHVCVINAVHKLNDESGRMKPLNFSLENKIKIASFHKQMCF